MGALQGKPLRRREDSRLLTGKGNYAADGRRPDMLVAVLVRSPHAHAAVARIDVAASRALPGVLGVFTQADLTDIGPIPGGIGFPRPDGGPAPKTDRTLLAAEPRALRRRARGAGGGRNPWRGAGSRGGGRRRLPGTARW